MSPMSPICFDKYLSPCGPATPITHLKAPDGTDLGQFDYTPLLAESTTTLMLAYAYMRDEGSMRYLTDWYKAFAPDTTYGAMCHALWRARSTLNHIIDLKIGRYDKFFTEDEPMATTLTGPLGGTRLEWLVLCWALDLALNHPR